MAIRIQLRRDTAANWTSVNPVLKAGEFGIETDTLKVKVGNGTSTWTQISSYLNITPAQLATTVTSVNAYTDTAVASLGNTAANTYVPLSDVGNIDGVASLDGTGKIPDTEIPAGITRDTELSAAISTEVTNRNLAITNAISNLIDGAPAALDTLNELAAAINDDASYAATITTALGLKAPLASPSLTGTPLAPTAAVDTNTTQIATTAFAKKEADDAEAAAATDATTKVAAEAALRVSGDAASVATAATDATTKVAAEAALRVSGDAASVSTAATDATTKVAAEAALRVSGDAASVATAATDATTKANAAQAAAIAAAATDATTKADAAQAAAIAAAATAAGSALTSAIATEVTNRNTAITNAVDGLVDGAPALLNTLNELAAAINDDANYTTTITTALGTKAPLDSPALTGTPTAPTAGANTSTTQIATTAFAKAEADAAEAAAIAAAATDATTKANAAQAAAATDATTKANAAQAAAATDATTKANAAQAAAATEATTKADAAQAAAIAAAATAAGSALTSAIATEVTNRNTAISGAVSTLVDGAPDLLNTLNEIAAAINDDQNYTTTITTALGTKAPLASPAFTGTVTGIDKTMVGLANVDNTTDALKPISTATQTALNLKAPLASPTFTGTVVLPDNTITNAMLAGSIANAKLANSSITINGNAVSLGGTVTLATGQAATESTLGTVYGKVTLAGVDNTSLGSLTFQNTETGILNTAIGNESLRTLSSGERNTVVGYQAGTLIETGSDNTLLGTGAGNTLLSGVNNIIIGSNAQAATNSTSNEIIIGNGSITTFKIPGIGLVASATDYIITATAAQNLTNKTITSPTIISPIFQGPISVFSPTDDSHAINRGYLVAELADAVGSDIIPLDSLSQLFDGYTSRFRLKFNGATFDPTNPYKLLITINGIIQILGNQDQHWLSALPSEGYFVDNDGYIQFGEPIPAGSSFEARYISGPNTQTVKKSRYPFRATDILLGD
jgi:hypothetical protein